jgi:hypothetical protein
MSSSTSSSLRWLRAIGSLALIALVGCGEGVEANVVVERLPDPEPNLPEVPDLPPPPHPTRYGDESYSIYGVRHMSANTMDHDVAVTGYIVEIYARPDCEDEEACPRAVAPHFYIADTANETDANKRILVAGYATRQGEVDDMVAAAARTRNFTQETTPGGPPPIPTDLALGNKVTVRARFQRYSGVGFSASNGLLEFQGHTTLEAASGS